MSENESDEKREVQNISSEKSDNHCSTIETKFLKNFKRFTMNAQNSIADEKLSLLKMINDSATENIEYLEGEINDLQFRQSEFYSDKICQLEELLYDLNLIIDTKSFNPLFTDTLQKISNYLSFTTKNTINQSAELDLNGVKEKNNSLGTLCTFDILFPLGEKILKFEKFPRRILSVDGKLVGLINDFKIINVFTKEVIIQESNRILEISCSSDNQLCYIIFNDDLTLVVYNFHRKTKQKISLRCLKSKSNGPFFFALINSYLFIKHGIDTNTYFLQPPYETYVYWKDNFTNTTSGQMTDHFLAVSKSTVHLYDLKTRSEMPSICSSKKRRDSIFNDIIEKLNNGWKLLSTKDNLVILNETDAIFYKSSNLFEKKELKEYFMNDKEIIFCLKSPLVENVLIEYYPRQRIA